MKMKLKKGDQVLIVSGKDKGKKGGILRVFPKISKIVVEGIALSKRHLKKRGGQSGRIVERPVPIDASNAMLIDPESKKPTRIGREMRDGARVRVAKKSKTSIA